MASLCSTMLILSMTFDRFYSIIRPHKAASFNTVKRAKITIISLVIFSIIYNIPHIYITSTEGRRCGPFGKAMKTIIGRFYYWFSLVLNFILPFILLLIMNSFIINTIRQRSKFIGKNSEIKYQGQCQGQNQNQDHNTKMKSSEMQIFVILLLVTFGFLILTFPSYALFFFMNIVDYKATPKIYADYLLFHSVGQKTYYTNFGVNFYLYVISGKKFRADLMKVFVKKKESQISLKKNTSLSTITSF